MAVLDQLLREAGQRARLLPHRSPRPNQRAGFAAALRGKGQLAVIAEFKRKSPSEGGIAPQKELSRQVATYAGAGAAAISVLTEPRRFGGSIADLDAAATATDLPLLLKDFVVDPRQIEQACAHGASACLLIARCLDRQQLRDLAACARQLRIAPLIECHNRDEVEAALQIEDAVIGANNRDLDTLAIDLERAPRLLAAVPATRVTVAESGYTTPSQTRGLRGLADAVLIGTALMRSGDPAAFLTEVAS